MLADNPEIEETEPIVTTSSELSSISLSYRRLPNTRGNF